MLNLKNIIIAWRFDDKIVKEFINRDENYKIIPIFTPENKDDIIKKEEFNRMVKKIKSILSGCEVIKVFYHASQFEEDQKNTLNCLLDDLSLVRIGGGEPKFVYSYIDIAKRCLKNLDNKRKKS